MLRMDVTNNNILTYISGAKGDNSANKLKKTILRYSLLSWTMMFIQVNSNIKSKFGTEDGIVEKGLATAEEIKLLKSHGSGNTGDLGQPNVAWLDLWWIPLNWCCQMIRDEMKKDGHMPRYLGTNKSDT